jgi:STE24 endopeptidase
MIPGFRWTLEGVLFCEYLFEVFQKNANLMSVRSYMPTMIDMNALLVAFLAVYLMQVVFSLFLEKLNLEYLKRRGGQAPPSFEGFIDGPKLSQITAYTAAKSRPGFIHEVLSESILLAMILGGFFVELNRYLLDHQFHYMLAGWLFFVIPGAIFTIADLPFDYYRTFVVEEKFGFNRSTLKIWITDHVKSGLISLVLFALLLFIVLWLVLCDRFEHSEPAGRDLPGRDRAAFQ